MNLRKYIVYCYIKNHVKSDISNNYYLRYGLFISLFNSQCHNILLFQYTYLYFMSQSLTTTYLLTQSGNLYHTSSEQKFLFGLFFKVILHLLLFTRSLPRIHAKSSCTGCIKFQTLYLISVYTNMNNVGKTKQELLFILIKNKAKSYQ